MPVVVGLGEMMNRPIQDGFSLVWRHQRLVWWIFFVNLVLGFLASVTPRAILHSALDKNIYSEQLSKRFDAFVFIELLTKPDISATPWAVGSVVVGLVFLFYILFISGGVLSVYHHDRKFTRGQFFEFCGDFFWRMVRLLLCSIIPFGIVLSLLSGVNAISGKMATNAASDTQGFWFQVIGSFVVLLMGLFVRAWFDLAQARTIIDHVRGMFALTLRSFVLALRNIPRFLFMYLVTTVVAGIAIVAAWYLWLSIPHTSFGASWLLLQLLSLLLIGIRLWQRAAMVLWYDNYAQLQAPPVILPPAPLPPSAFIEVESTPVEAAPAGIPAEVILPPSADPKL
jgi:hypothetical protein